MPQQLRKDLNRSLTRLASFVDLLSPDEKPSRTQLDSIELEIRRMADIVKTIEEVEASIPKPRKDEGNVVHLHQQ